MTAPETMSRWRFGALQAGVFCGARSWPGEGEPIEARSPVDGGLLARVETASPAQVELLARRAQAAFYEFRSVPAPLRGELVRRIGQRVRESKEDLAILVAWESGKILDEARGEVQEWIDICDFATGLSRQLYGLTIASERANHRMMEQWHPLGPVGVITAFNFPVAVWAWNAMIGLVCGDPILWKPSEKTPLTAVAAHGLAVEVLAGMENLPQEVLILCCGGRDVGEAIAASTAIPMVSATGSVAMGRSVAAAVGRRLGHSLLELGGNNAAIVAPSADLEVALRGVIFSAFGTAGQRCTTLRRLILHREIAPRLLERLIPLLGRLPAGAPLDENVLLGPLIDAQAFESMQRALDEAKRAGASVDGGDRITRGVPAGGFYVRPAIVEIEPEHPLVQRETFAPILYVHRYSDLEEAISIQNGVPQGLSSTIFTRDLLEAERFLSASGSDCGIANVNIGTSGAEIGGAFGGEKETGGGRESGSDSWKAYMRRTTNTINYGSELPLAQGVRFDLTPEDRAPEG